MASISSQRWFISNKIADHLIPFFCPHNLVGYRSQELIPFLRDQNRPQLSDLEIKSGERSRRLDPEALEDFWAIRSQATSIQFPAWAKGDLVLQKIKSTTSQSAALARPANLSPSPVSPSSPGTEDMSMSNHMASTATSPEMVHSTIEKPDQKPEKQPGIMSSTPPMRKSTRKISQKRRNTARSDINRLQKTRKSSTQNTDSSTISRIQKASRRPGRRTRSHQLTDFFELDEKGIAKILPDG